MSQNWQRPTLNPHTSSFCREVDRHSTLIVLRASGEQSFTSTWLRYRCFQGALHFFAQTRRQREDCGAFLSIFIPFTPTSQQQRVQAENVDIKLGNVYFPA